MDYGMVDECKRTLWANFGGAIDMLKNAIAACPDELWDKDTKFYYIACHTTIFLDYYLSSPVADFQPALPYTITDATPLPAGAVDDVIPNKHYSKQEVLASLSSIREKCRKTITLATEAALTNRWIKDHEINLHGLCPTTVIRYTVLDILFYNLRHVQHHVGQLHIILRQESNAAPGWVSQAD